MGKVEVASHHVAHMTDNAHMADLFQMTYDLWLRDDQMVGEEGSYEYMDEWMEQTVGGAEWTRLDNPHPAMIT